MKMINQERFNRCTSCPEAIPLFVVYQHPRDYPEFFVVRKFEFVREPNPFTAMLRATDEYRLSYTLEGVRSYIPTGMICFGRGQDDDPCIVETWL